MSRADPDRAVARERISPEIKQFVKILPEPAFLLASPSGQVLYANAAASDLTRIAAADLLDQTIANLVTDEPAKVQDYLRLCARSRQMIPGSLTWRTAAAADGERTVEGRCDGAVIQPRSETAPATLFVRCRPKAEATDQFVLLNQKIEALSKEIIERRKAEQQRDELLHGERAARIEAERISRMKDEFLATLSHELRTPLNAILGWSQILQSEPLTPTGIEGIEVIARNARVQTQLIEDLLDMSRIISGKIRLDIQRVDLLPVIEAAVATVRPAAEAKGIRLQLALDPIAGPVKGDPNRLQQVLWNLLSNAVKFTPKGGRVQVILERVNSHLEISVADSGAGIRPEFLPHVFDRFQQADSSATRRHGGLGLGLSIVKQLVELHGGSVWAKSPGEGKGATFNVILPLMLVHDLPEKERSERVHPSAVQSADGHCLTLEQDLGGVDVLVVEDEPDARELVKRLLENCKASVRTVGSAAEAFDALLERRPDVLISDIGMPGMDGFAFIRALRARPAERGGRVPAVAVTAFARTEDRTRAMLAGFNIHLSKPLEPSELIACVASLAGRTGA